MAIETSSARALYEYRTVRTYINNKHRFVMEEDAIPLHYGIEDGRAFVLYAVRIDKKDVE